MPHKSRLLFIAFIESFATILLERGFYFYTRDILGFTEFQNLLTALMFGVVYVGGAYSSHAISRKLTEKHTFIAAIAILAASNLGIFLFPQSAFIVLSFAVIAFTTGLKWPILESYISAGQAPSKVLKMVGYFSLSWASAAPLSLGISGFLIGSSIPLVFFLIAMSIHIASIFFCLAISTRPQHLQQDHPDRLRQYHHTKYKHLLYASRYSMLSSYTLLFLLAPLMPSIFAKLGFDVQISTGLSGLLDLMRFLAFLILGLLVGWHGKSTSIFIMIFALPLGFFMILMGDNLLTVLLGELLFGLASGLMYYGALYYALVIKNAAVDAGGAHESLIGAGFALGPLIGIIGTSLHIHSNTTSSIAIVATPLIVACMFLAFYHLYKVYSDRVKTNTSN